MSLTQFLKYLLLLVFAPRSLRTMEWKLLRFANQERKFKNLSPLKMQFDLRAVARKHSKDMAVKDYFSHRNKKGEKPADRLKVARITDVASGENLAKIGGYHRPTELAHEGLMKSAGHRKNILNRQYNCVGVGVYKSRNGVYYFTQVFAAREICFSSKIRKRASLSSGLLLKGALLQPGGQILYQLKKEGERGVSLEDVYETEGRKFSFRAMVDEPGVYRVSLFFSPTGRGQFYLVNEFTVKFTNWF